MNPLVPIARRWLGLPPARHRSERSTHWLPLSDGTRLATTLLRPIGGSGGLPALLVRTPQAAHARTDPPLLLARLLAESGYAVVVQECRGRHSSEGSFHAFDNEADDGAETVEWIAKQPWFGGQLGLLGFGYAGFAAWATLSRVPDRVQALVVGLAARDPYAWFHAGGALQFEYTLAWTLATGDREEVSPRRIDLARGTAFRPAREADRVALRAVDWYRECLEHPERDDFWSRLSPEMPANPPASLLIGGWNHPTLGGQLDDHATLVARSEANGTPSPELLLGPWGSGPRPRLERGAALLPTCMRASFDFLERRFRGTGPGGAAVRAFVRGEARSREGARWPLPSAEPQLLYLRGAGRLEAVAPPSDEEPDHFTYDPDDAVISGGGALRYTMSPLPADLRLCGPVRVVLFAHSDALATDFAAKLIEITTSGKRIGLCDGLVRCRRGAAPKLADMKLEIDLFATATCVAAGHRLCVEISSSNFPRFDRHPNTLEEPALVEEGASVSARQTVFHDRERPSHLVLHALH